MVMEMKNGEFKAFPNFKGGEKEMTANMFFDGDNRILLGRLQKGASIGYHKHEGNCEVIFILEGKAKYLMDDGVEYASAGQCHYCPEGHSHAMINECDEDLVFFAVVPKQ